MKYFSLSADKWTWIALQIRILISLPGKMTALCFVKVSFFILSPTWCLSEFEHQLRGEVVTECCLDLLIAYLKDGEK